MGGKLDLNIHVTNVGIVVVIMFSSLAAGKDLYTTIIIIYTQHVKLMLCSPWLSTAGLGNKRHQNKS